jgi:hypothetical protein
MDVFTVNVALVAPAGMVTLEGTLAVPALPLESRTFAPPAGAGPLNLTVPLEDCVPPMTIVGFKLSDEREKIGGDEDFSKIKTAGFRSLNGTATSFDGEITYAMALPPDPEVAMIPLPFVDDEDREYEALNATLDFGPLGAPISSMPVILPVGLAPSAVNSPEKILTPNVPGVIVEPTYGPFTAVLVNNPAAWGSPNPNKTELSELKRKA